MQALKDGDEISLIADADNLTRVMFFTNSAQLYYANVSDFDTCKASALGDYIPVKLKMDEGERALFMMLESDISDEGHFVFVFENGKGVRVPVSAYKTKSARRKLTGAFSAASALCGVHYEKDSSNILLISDNDKAISINTRLIPEKSTRTSVGVQLVTLKGKQKLVSVIKNMPEGFGTDESYRKIKIPAVGVSLTSKDKKILKGSL